jgi:hypothetical protein
VDKGKRKAKDRMTGAYVENDEEKGKNLQEATRLVRTGKHS